MNKFSPRLIFLIAIIVSFFLSSCSLILTPRGEPAFEHTIRYQGESSAVVSSWYTGTPHNAKRIRRFNRLGSAKLAIGQQILIPKHLLIRTSNLPKSFVTATYAQKQRDTGPTSTSTRQVSIVKKEVAPLDLVPASASSIVKNNAPVSEGIVRQSKGNEWVREELERDSLQEHMINGKR